jgi:tRNA modification GTPase
MRDTTDTVEQIGIELAKERIPWADLVLWVVDATDTSGGWREELQAVRAQARAVWMVINKIDLNPAAFSQEPFVPLLSDSSLSQQNFFISARSGAGVPALMEALVQDLAQVAPEGGDVGEVVTNERHRDCLERAERSLEAFCEGVRGGEVPITIAAADIKSALGALDEVVGKTYTEDILGRIFSKFCIGK